MYVNCWWTAEDLTVLFILLFQFVVYIWRYNHVGGNSGCCSRYLLKLPVKGMLCHRWSYRMRHRVVDVCTVAIGYDVRGNPKLNRLFCIAVPGTANTEFELGNSLWYSTGKEGCDVHWFMSPICFYSTFLAVVFFFLIF